MQKLISVRSLRVVGASALTIILAVGILGWSFASALAADTGFLFPTVNNNSGWDNPQNAYTSNDVRAVANLDADIADYSGFNIPTIPAGANINGIEVVIEGYNEGGSPDRQADVSLSWNGGTSYTSGGSGIKQTNLPSDTSAPFTDGTSTLGGATDTWGRTWSATEFATSTFRVKLDTIAASSNDDLLVDQVRVRIHYTLDTAAPTATIDLQSGSDAGSSNVDNITNATALIFDVNFNESVTGLVAGDFSFTGTATGCVIGTITGSGASYDVPVNSCANGTSPKLRLAASAVTDGASNPNAQTDGPTVFIDRTAPTVEILQASGQTDPTAVSPVVFEATFSEGVDDFNDANDVVESGTAGTFTAALSGGNPYTLTVTGMDNSGTVIVTIPAGVAQDTAGNGNVASTNTDNTVTFVFPTYEFDASAGAGGTITPSGIFSVNQGVTQNFSIAANNGFVLLQVTIDGVIQSVRSNFISFVSVTADHVVSAIFDGGWKAPTNVPSTSNLPGGTSANNAFTSNDSRTTFDNGGDRADYNTFGFSIPAGSTINGIEVALEGNRDSGSTRNFEVVLSANGTTFTATTTASGWSTGDRTIVIGGPSATWGRTWTAAEINSANFRVRIAATGGGDNIYLDHVQVKVHSTPDTTAPNGGSVTYTNGYFTTASVPVTYTLGSDAGAGLNTASGKLQRASATLSSGSCGTFGSFSDLVTEFDGSHTDATVANGNCYKYQYVISDNAGNPATYTSANIAKIDTVKPVTTITGNDATNGDADVITNGGLSDDADITIDFGATDAESGVASSECQLDAGVYAPCTNPVSYTGLSNGSHTVHIRSTDIAGNLESTATFTWIIDTTKPTITLNGTSPVNVAYGVGYSDEGATASDNLDVSVPVVVGGDTITAATPVGSYSITYDAMDDAGNVADQVVRTVNVTQTTLVVTASSGTMVYGGTIPTITPVYGTFLNGDDAGDIDTAPTCSTVATAASPIGDYASNCSGGSDNNYTFSFVAGIVGVTEAELTITADDQTKTYGDTFTFVGTEFTAAGLLNGDTVDSVTLTSLGAPDTATVADYAIVASSAVGTGLGNYTIVYEDGTLSVEKAAAIISITPYAGVYDGDPHGISGTAAGVNGEDLNALLDLGDTFTNVGNHTANWTFDGDANHAPTSGSAAVSISTATPVCTVTGFSGPYDGNAHGATGSCLGVDGETLSGLDLGDSYTNAPGGIAHWNYPGSLNYTDQSGDVSITIGKANAVIVVNAYNVDYDGTEHVSTGTATGINSEVLTGLNLSATAHTAAGDYTGDAWTFLDVTGNYNDAVGTVDNFIGKATTVVTVTCEFAEYVYTGSAIAPCTATATGPNGLNEVLTVNYTANIDTGTVTASAEYLESADYDGSTGSDTFDIVAAGSTTVITCPVSVAYTGSAEEPCTALVTGAGSFSQSVAVTYANNTDAGTATANAAFLGNANHAGSSDTETFEIEEATSVVTVTCVSPQTYTGSPIEACSASYTTSDGLTGSLSVDYTDNVNVGTASGSATYAGDANHVGNTSSDTFLIEDNVAPVVTVPANMIVEATSAAGADVTFTATAADDVDGSITPSCTPVSGSTFPIAVTTVTCEAADSAGNSSSASFTITVEDTTAPVIEAHADVNASATGVLTQVGYTAPNATDAVDGTFPATCLPASGSDFAVGPTLVTCNATDTDGNAAVATTFSVIVEDDSAPTILLGGDSVVEFGTGDAYTDAGATASDAVDGDLTASIVVGGDIVDTNVPGSYVITYNVSDLANNPALEVTRTVNVTDDDAPIVIVPADITTEATSPSGAVVSFTATASDNVDGPLATVCAPASGSTFSVGTLAVNCDATDTEGNTGSASFLVTVTDTSAPTIVLTGDNPQVLEKGSAYAELGATASDVVDGDLTASIIIDASLVDTNTIGSYAVTYNVTDSNSNAAPEVTRTVTVVDTTAPDTTITSNPTNPTTSTTGEFTFSATEGGSTFECRVDGGTYALCTSPFTTATLGDGSHIFEVRATDADGNTDATPASFTWDVDATGPVTIFTTAPDEGSTTENDFAQFNFQTDPVDGSASFWCSFDGALFNPCTSPTTLTSLTDTTHTFAVRAVDSLGNPGETVTRTWTVNADAPILSNEALGTVTTDSITVTWTTDHEATSRVVYDTVSHDPVVGSAPNYGYAFSTTEIDTPAEVNGVTSHSVTITGLDAGETYYFRPVSQGSPEAYGIELSATTEVPAPTTGTLIVKKVIVGTTDDTAEDFSFTITAGDSIAPPVAFEADGQNDFPNKAPDTYTVTEVAAPGYTTTYANCANVVLAAGETETCTITNTKQVVNPIDVCTNIGGVQTELPSGHHFEGEGICVPDEVPPTDVCTNIGGIQEELPDGFHFEGEGICVPDETEEPVDVCENISGMQEELPDGYFFATPSICIPLSDEEASCDVGVELLENGGFEAPVVTKSQLWDIFPSGMPGLGWFADWTEGDGAPEIANVEIQENGLYGNFAAASGTQWTELDSDWNGPVNAGPSGEKGGVAIFQFLHTEVGAEYTVSFDFAARPNTASAQNVVEIHANDTLIGTVGPTTDSWTSHTFSFIANDEGTTITFSYSGEANDSSGALLDNASVKCTAEPVTSCEKVTRVYTSDEDTTAEGIASVVLTALHSAWTAVIDGASWIWSEYPMADAENEVSETFVKEFVILGEPTTATLEIAADNSYQVFVNGSTTPACADSTEFNYQAEGQDVCTIAPAFLETGENTLAITVKNLAQANGTQASNPAGLIYKLTIESNSCELPPVECDENEHEVNGQCVPNNDDSPTCEQGESLVEGECVPNEEEPKDVCSNLSGIQSELPDGMRFSNGDNCVKDKRTPSSNRRGASGGGQVLGASTCGPLLSQYLKFGWNNDASEVSKLQNFLNMETGSNLTVDGIFGSSTFDAVENFQKKYWQQVLQPWFGKNDSGITGEDTPTGYVYQTTKWQINNIFCPGSEAFPELI